MLTDWEEALLAKATCGLANTVLRDGRSLASQWGTALRQYPPDLPVVLQVSESAEVLAGLEACWRERRWPLFGDPGWGHSERTQLGQSVGHHLCLLREGELIEQPAPVRIQLPPLTSGSIGIATGGSTGQLRFARHDARSLSAAAHLYRTRLAGLSPHTASFLPLYHISGFMPLVRALETGGDWLAASPSRRSLEDLPGLREKILTLVPAQLFRFLKNPSDRKILADMPLVILGGGPVGEELRAAAQEAGVNLQIAYGMTETAAMIALADPACSPLSYRPLDGVQIRCQQGELLISSPSLFTGYWGQSSRSQTFWSCGDCGELLSDGRFLLSGRKNNLYISGGEKIDPGEVEKALRASGLAQWAWVGSRPHPEWGDELILVAVPQKDVPAEEMLWQNTLKSSLARHKIPRHIRFVNEIPVDDKGKIPRLRLLQLFADT